LPGLALHPGFERTEKVPSRVYGTPNVSRVPSLKC
jgi:hypothetical protein